MLKENTLIYLCIFKMFVYLSVGGNAKMTNDIYDKR